MQNRMR